MERKPIFTPNELEAIFSGSESQKITVIKKDMAKILLRYLLANPQIKSENEDIYNKALIVQTKNILCNPSKTPLEESMQLVKEMALFDVENFKGRYTSQGAMQLLMNIFFSL